ncbi:MAG: type II secretion system GspH family protein [Puniceicoccales bacterium]|jgi:prepilin-type N-terminal cleavage/methylation domain-containing protein|nr:type II secretion system GspH family protein [Puniceicoccales bacterium]
MKRNQSKFRKGFTLVEMLGVLAIIAILMSIVAVGVLSAINRTRIVATMSNFKNLETAILGFVALPEAGGKLPLTKHSNASKIFEATSQEANATVNAFGGNQSDLHLEIPFIEVGLLERHPTWRVGNDGVATGRVELGKEYLWNRNKSAFTTKETSSSTARAGNDWTDYIRAECAPVDPATTVVPGTYDASGMMSTAGVNFMTDGTTRLSGGTRCAYVIIPGLSLKDATDLSKELNGALNEADLKNPAANKQTKGRFVFAAPGTGEESVVGYYMLANL